MRGWQSRRNEKAPFCLTNTCRLMPPRMPLHALRQVGESRQTDRALLSIIAGGALWLQLATT